MQRTGSAALRIGVILALALCILGQAAMPALAAPIFNGGFESGDLSGWIVGSGMSGGVSVVGEFQADGADTPYYPDGAYYALLSSGEPEAWTSIRQTFDVAAGDTISCHAFYVPAPGKHAGDAAEIRILKGNSTVATLISWTPENVGDNARVQWTILQPQPVPQAGQYTLEARIKAGDETADPGYLGLEACEAGPSRAASPADFTVQADGTDVEIAWQTGAGEMSTGFNIYRSSSAGGNYEKINDGPLPADLAPPDTRTYSYLDSPGQGTFFYKLESLRDDGNQMYGPNSTGPAASAAGKPAFRRPQRHPRPPAVQ